MFIDYINCLLEFSSVLFFFLIFITFTPSKSEYVRYYICAAFLSLLFVFLETPLLFNVSSFLILPLVSFRQRSRDQIILMAISVMCVIYLEFMLYSLIPVFLLQTNSGNLVVNLIILTLLFSFFILARKREYYEILNPFLFRHKFSILIFLLFTVLLGQSYLSRLSVFWTYLPGVISLTLFIIIFLSICIYTHYARSADKLRINLITTHLSNIEACVLSLRIQNHDNKHHLRNLRNQINTAQTLNELQNEVNFYMDQLENDRSILSAILNITQPVLRSVIYGCYVKCLQENIAFDFHSSDQLPNFPLKDYQIVELLENLTINAIEQNLLLPESKRYISLRFFVEDKHNEITITNPVTDASLPLSDMLITGTTTKNSVHHQGLGLTSIQKICSSNHIDFFGQREDESVSFSIAYEEA